MTDPTQLQPQPATTDTPMQDQSMTPPEFPPYVSPTLQRLDKKFRPKDSTVCEACPASVWFASTEGVKCYCRTMHLVTWSNEEPNTLTACDGEVVANLERQAQLLGG